MGSTRIRKAPASEIDRKAARAAEEGYFERLSHNINLTGGLFDPLTNRTYDASPRNRVTKVLDDRSSEVKSLIKRFAERDLMRAYEEMPKNELHVYEIVHKELLGRPSVKVVVAGAAFSPVEDLVRSGSSRTRIPASELLRAKDQIVKSEHVFYYINAFATTGWEDEARRALVGNNHLIALSDVQNGAWRTYYAPDPRWRAAARIFDLSSEEEKVEAVRRWVSRHTLELLMDELTEDTVFDALGYAIPIIREAFTQIAAEDRYVRFDTSARPYRLTRVYG
ncbi:MAG TPA: hypothetical protein VKW04_22050 [Planctomycetota bacterium]|nr:hypothetical protein [Planctomycetota bacterium]